MTNDFYEEKWADIPEAPNYMVSNYGEVINKLTDKTMNGSFSKDGAKRVTLIHRGNHFSRYIHRLVAEAFLVDFDPKYEVVHKRGKQDNSIWNLKMGLEIASKGVRRDSQVSLHTEDKVPA